MLRYAEQLNEVELKPLMIGDEIIPVRSLLELSYPITEGIIENEDDMLEQASVRQSGVAKFGNY